MKWSRNILFERKSWTLTNNSLYFLFLVLCTASSLLLFPLCHQRVSATVSVLWSGTFKESTQCFAYRKQNIIDRSSVCMWPYTKASIQHPATSKINQKTRQLVSQQFNTIVYSHNVEADFCVFRLFMCLELNLPMMGFKLMYQSSIIQCLREGKNWNSGSVLGKHFRVASLQYQHFILMITAALVFILKSSNVLNNLFMPGL